MPIGSTNISMQGIANEKQATQLPAAAQNISLKGLSVDGTNDFQFIGGAFTDIVVAGSSPDQSAPHGMGEFNGYEQFAWGTPVLPSGANVSKIFNMVQEHRGGNDTCVVCSFNMTLNTTSKTISYGVVGTDDGGGFGPDFTVGTGGSITYSGVLSSLEARFVHVGQAITASGSGNGANGTVRELFSNSSFLSANNIDENTIDSTPGDSTSVSTHNDITGGPAGTYGALRTNSGSMAVAIACTSDDCQTDNDASFAYIRYTGTDSLTIQLRANNSTVVNLYSRAGSFSMEAETSEEDTS